MCAILFGLLLFFQTTASDSTDEAATATTQYTEVDTAQVTPTEFSTTDLQKLRADDELRYKEPPSVAASWWSRFKSWLGTLIRQLLSGVVSTDATRIIMFLLAGAVLVAVILMWLRVNAFRIFFSGSDQGLTTHAVFHDNIHEMDFEKLIREAIDANDFRNATRLVFLHALKLLSDRQMINWVPGKTNHDYLQEISKPAVKGGFGELSYYFDYAWYGHFSISPEVFNRVQTAFREWRKQID